MFYLYCHAGKKTTGVRKRTKSKKLEISLWFRCVGFFLCKVSADFCHLKTDSKHAHAFRRAAEFGFIIESCSPPAFPARKAENTMFLPQALLTAGLAEQVENDYPTLSCQCPNRCWLFQASLSQWIPSGLADRLWGSGILAQEQGLFFLAGPGAGARVKTCLLLSQGCCREQQAALHTTLLQDVLTL